MRVNVVLPKVLLNDKTRPGHLALVVALFQVAWESQSGVNRIRVSRKTLMNLSKIRSVTTYHKTVRELCAMGIISYEPSFDPGKCSEFRFLN
jgi:hypothetical protein